MKLMVAVMSFNRGTYLENCVRSIRKNFCFDYSLVIIDDNSTDRETLAILNTLAVSNRVIMPTISGSSVKHKGLYANMNYVLQLALSEGYRTLAIFQDDTQVIRMVSGLEIQTINSILELADFPVVVPLFFKKNHLKNYHDLLAYNSDLQFYFAKRNDHKYLNGIADMGIFNLKKLAAANWFFENDETRNIYKGMQLGFKRAVLKNPFLAYLPWPKTYRHRISNFNDFFTFFTDKLFKAGFHPYKDLTGKELDKLILRSAEVIPFAEDYLETVDDVRLIKPWNYYESSFPIRNQLKKIIKKIYE